MTVEEQLEGQYELPEQNTTPHTGVNARRRNAEGNAFMIFSTSCYQIGLSCWGKLLPIIKGIWVGIESFMLFQFVLIVAMGQLLRLHIKVHATNIGRLSVLRLRNPGLFTRHRKNKCLVFEEPYNSFFDHNKNGILEKLGRLAPSRMKYVKKMHIIQESEKMAYLVKHAGGCHYEVFFADVVSALELTPVKYKIYWKDIDYNNKFLVLLAEKNNMKRIIDRFNFHHVDKMLSCQPVIIGDSRQKKRTGFGFSSSINNCHEVAINTVGATEPRKRDDTYEKGAIHNFLAITEVTSNIYIPWLED